MSEIVKKFYNRLEKIGLKEHYPNQNEIDHLNNLPKIDKLTALNDECVYNVNRVYYKMHITRILSIIIFLSTFYFLSFNWTIPTFTFLTSLLIFKISNTLDTKLFVWRAQNGLFYCLREELLNKKKDKNLTKGI